MKEGAKEVTGRGKTCCAIHPVSVCLHVVKFVVILCYHHRLRCIIIQLLINITFHPTVLADIATVSKKTQGIMADGQGDDDEDEGVPEEKRLADDVRADNKVEQRQ